MIIVHKSYMKEGKYVKIFISWSKERGRTYALETNKLFNDISSEIDTFISENDIYSGESIQEVILKNIEWCDVLIMCITKENRTAPWLIFEAGYAKGLGKKVIPLLFDENLNSHSWINNPLHNIQPLMFNNETFSKILIRDFGIENSQENVYRINEYKNNIIEMKNEKRYIDKECEDLVDKMIERNSFCIESPSFIDRVAYFHAGFESYDLYRLIIDSFLYTGKYLWIYGRKNMKLATSGFDDFFKYLEEKARFGMDGIDFKCLYLHPDSIEVERAHVDPKLLKSELDSSLQRIKKKVDNNPFLSKSLRFYSCRREEVIIRIDNSIVYTKLSFDSHGYPQILTNSGFEVFSVESKKGQKCIETFINVWDNSENFNSYFNE